MDRAELDAQSVFYEKQSFRQWWIWLILLGVDEIFLSLVRFSNYSWANSLVTTLCLILY